jgi:hypothetical protein
MASIVAGIGASHSIMLMAKLEDWPHFAQVDKERAKYYFDKAGNPTNYEALLAVAPKGLDEILLPEAIRARYEQCQTGLAKLRDAVGRVAPDIIVIIGDDQKEMSTGARKFGIGRPRKPKFGIGTPRRGGAITNRWPRLFPWLPISANIWSAL